VTGERGLQQAVFEFLRHALPEEAVCFAIPNGDGRMTTMPGTLAGMPDVGVLYRGRMIFIELKTEIGAVKPRQRFVHGRLTLAGAVVAVCRSLDEVDGFLSQLMPLRARINHDMRPAAPFGRIRPATAPSASPPMQSVAGQPLTAPQKETPCFD
jgi:hypothetical protein